MRRFFSYLVLFFLIASSFAFKTIKGKDGVEMVLIPEGVFYMGSSGKNYPLDEQPRHKVYLDAYYIDKYEVSNRNFVEFLNATRPGEGEGGKRWSWVVIRNDLETEERSKWYPTEIIYINGHYEVLKGFEDYPVVTVSWFAAKAYCEWVGERLPTEAEWEKAARGGLKDRDFPWGNTLPTRDSAVAFERVWRENFMPAPTVPVYAGPYNPYGLFGMAGNVEEWTIDWYDPEYYKRSPYSNPRGPSSGQNKVVRGGSWASAMMGIRVGARYSYPPQATGATVGFRCVKDVE